MRKAKEDFLMGKARFFPRVCSPPKKDFLMGKRRPPLNGQTKKNVP